MWCTITDQTVDLLPLPLQAKKQLHFVSASSGSPQPSGKAKLGVVKTESTKKARG